MTNLLLVVGVMALAMGLWSHYKRDAGHGETLPPQVTMKPT
jgi:hypothetical protein